MIQLDIPLAEQPTLSDAQVRSVFDRVVHALGDPAGWECEAGIDPFVILPSRSNPTSGGRYVHTNGTRMFAVGLPASDWSLYLYQPTLVIDHVDNALRPRYVYAPMYIGDLPGFGHRLEVETWRRALYWCGPGQDHMDSLQAMVWHSMLDMIPDPEHHPHWHLSRYTQPARNPSGGGFRGNVITEYTLSETVGLDGLSASFQLRTQPMDIPHTHPVIATLGELGFWEAYVVRQADSHTGYRFLPCSRIRIDIAASAHQRAQQIQQKRSSMRVLALPKWAQTK